MAEGIKISEFEEIDELQDGCCIPTVSEGQNRRILKSKLFEQFATELFNSEAFKAQIRDKFFPVGCYYASVDNPSLYIGGTWTSNNVKTYHYYGTESGTDLVWGDNIGIQGNHSPTNVLLWKRTA